MDGLLLTGNFFAQTAQNDQDVALDLCRVANSPESQFVD